MTKENPVQQKDESIGPLDLGKDPKDIKVLVAMSGGVDSSVTAALLKTQGYQVIGVHMQLWDHGNANVERFGGRCCSLIDSNDARRVCDRLDIPYYVVNAQEEFKEQVVDYFVHEYVQTRTPNPCAMCNNKIKFGYLFRKADQLGCEMVATGHYAQVKHEPISGLSRMYKGVDHQKDQSYFLFGLTQEALQRTFMPLGELSKKMVRKLALEFDLGIAEKPDSMEICFIAEEGYKKFIENRVAPEMRPAGVIQLADGTVVGEHHGIHRYTIGQRKGLELNIKEDKDLYYVIGFDYNSHAVIVGTEEQLFHRNLTASQVSWLKPMNKLKPIRCRAKIRSRHQESTCTVVSYENGVAHIEFEEKQRAITPGQAVVFYEGNELLGGGFIDRFGV